MADAHDEPEDVVEPARGRAAGETEAVPAPMAAQESEGVRVGEAQAVAVAKVADPERVAMAAIVAEVAAVERFAPEESAAVEAQEEKTEEMPAIGLPPPPPPRAADAPLIVEPASIALFRKQEAADAAAAAALSAEDAARLRDEKRGFIKLGDGEFQLPGTDLLEYIPPANQDHDKQPLYDMAERVEQAMSNYGVRGKVKEIHMGPVVTMYEFAPAPGTRTGKIANLEKDLAMALEAQAVRIVAPIPGKAVVGVEVPNKSREMVYLKEILQDTSFATATSKLQVALGKDIKGAPVSVNLSKMPHLLVAGTTGSGKSVAVNGMITSLLYNASPEDVRFIMVDPKMLELSIYEGIPHLLLPVVTDPKKANLALRWAVDEMERRYELLAKTGVRDISSYNARIEGDDKKKDEAAAAAEAARKSDKKIRVVIAGPDGTEQEVDLDADAEITLAEGADGDTGGIVNVEAPSDEDLSDAAAKVQSDKEKAAAGEEKPTKLPYIVIVIDEFADLMMVAPKDVETSRRAAGAEGARRGPAPDPGDAAAVGRRDHRPHQGELPQPDRASGRVAHRFAHDPRSARRGDAARQRRHAVLGPRHQAAPHSRRLPVGRGGSPRGRVPQAAGQARLRHGHPQAARGGRGGGRRARERLPRRVLRPGGRDRLRHAPGVGLVHPAAAADRLQPRRAHGRADGARGHRRSDQRRQAARGAGPVRRIPVGRRVIDLSARIAR